METMQLWKLTYNWGTHSAVETLRKCTELHWVFQPRISKIFRGCSRRGNRKCASVTNHSHLKDVAFLSLPCHKQPKNGTSVEHLNVMTGYAKECLEGLLSLHFIQCYGIVSSHNNKKNSFDL